MQQYVKYTLIAIATLFFTGFAWKQVLDDTPPFAHDTIAIQTEKGVRTLNVEIAENPPQWERGLMYRTKLDTNHGMLFIFGKPSRISMWMKDTYIPLAILFIDEAGKIVRIETHAVPLSETIISSGQEVVAALEINASDLQKLGIQREDIVIHSAFHNFPSEDEVEKTP